ncbi:ABC transporter ATP-binding protein [Sulfurospirillum sp. 1307]|jgi:putative ABC transport system ATP-binding protein
MIECKNLTKIYKDVKALNDVSFTCKKGEVIVLKGSSGSGKSTLLSLIAGLAKPTFGEVIIKGKRISKMPDNFVALFRRENLGFIFQRYNLIPNLSVFDNIITPLIPSNPDEKTIEKEVNRLLLMLGIKDKKNTIVKNLSGGEQQRVAIARSLINNPSIIIADEPTANLDEKLSLEFIKTIKELKNDSRTIIIATHDPLFFELDFVDRIITMKNGKIDESNS